MTGTKALTLITGGGDIARDSVAIAHGARRRAWIGVRTRAASTAVARAVSRACTERRAERQRRGGARAGCRVAARALEGAAQRRACWVPRSGAGRRTGHRGRIHEGAVCFSAKLEFIEKKN